MRSPLRYPGGKNRAAKRIVQMIPDDIIEYREPLVGGGSVFFEMLTQKRAKYYWINDLYEDLIHFYQVTFNYDEKHRLLADLRRMKSMDDPKQIWDMFHDSKFAYDPYMKALRFFFLNRCSFSGSTESGGFSKQAAATRFTESAINLISELPSFHHGITVTNVDYSTLLMGSAEKVFVYLDPPYMTAKRLYGKNGALHTFDHERLANNLKNTLYRWLLSYDDCPLIRELYKDFNIHAFELQYGMSSGGAAKPVKKGAELLISNY